MIIEAIAAAALLAQAGEPGVAAAQPQIVVDGSGSVKTAPDVANLDYDVQGEGPTSDRAVSSLVAKSGAVEAALRSIDPALTLTSEAVRVRTVRGADCPNNDDSDYGRVQLSTGACAVAGYRAEQDFNARTARVADAGTMVGLAGRTGASDAKISAWDIADNRAARQKAISAAIEDARTKAQAVAAGTGVRLGTVLSVRLDRASVEEIVVTGSRRPQANSETDPIRVSVSPEPVDTTAQVVVTYAIAP